MRWLLDSDFTVINCHWKHFSFPFWNVNVSTGNNFHVTSEVAFGTTTFVFRKCKGYLLFRKVLKTLWAAWDTWSFSVAFMNSFHASSYRYFIFWAGMHKAQSSMGERRLWRLSLKVEDYGNECVVSWLCW